MYRFETCVDTLLEDMPQLILVIVVTSSCQQDLQGISLLSVIVTCAAIFFALVKVSSFWQWFLWRSFLKIIYFFPHPAVAAAGVPALLRRGQMDSQ